MPGLLGARHVQRDDIGRCHHLVQRQVAKVAAAGRLLVRLDVVRHDLPPEPVGDRGDVAADVARGNDAERTALEIEALQPGLRDVTAAGPVDRLDQVVADRQEQREDVLGHRVLA